MGKKQDKINRLQADILEAKEAIEYRDSMISAQDEMIANNCDGQIVIWDRSFKVIKDNGDIEMVKCRKCVAFEPNIKPFSDPVGIVNLDGWRDPEGAGELKEIKK